MYEGPLFRGTRVIYHTRMNQPTVALFVWRAELQDSEVHLPLRSGLCYDWAQVARSDLRHGYHSRHARGIHAWPPVRHALTSHPTLQAADSRDRLRPVSFCPGAVRWHAVIAELAWLWGTIVLSRGSCFGA